MSGILSAFILLAFFVFFVGLAAIVWNAFFSQVKTKKFVEKKLLFQWHFDKLLLAYKIYLLNQDIKKEGISLDDLREIEEEVLGTKSSTKHVLDEVKEEVRGELVEVKEEPRKKGSSK